MPEKSLASEVDDIVTCLRGFGADIAAVGLEAGTLTQWLTYGLREAGFRAVVMEARHVDRRHTFLVSGAGGGIMI